MAIGRNGKALLDGAISDPEPELASGRAFGSVFEAFPVFRFFLNKT